MEKIIKKTYVKPEIIHETKLEVRAGSVIEPAGQIPGLTFPFPPGKDNTP
jgi:hypothetical protein